ncbi:MAG TPA: hypothetical protein VNN55_10445 [bacterium]|nr:hypothetical protein [bacterium]
MAYLGDYKAGTIVDFKFTTVSTTGAPTTLAGSPAAAVYKINGTTESTAGVTLTVDFDTRTGLNHVRVDTSADSAFYAAAADYAVVLTAGTVGGTSVAGYVIALFSIEHRSVNSTIISDTIAQSNHVTVISPITSSTMTLDKGDAYQASDGTAITLTKAAGEIGWPTTVSTIDWSCWPDATLLAEQPSAVGLDDIALTGVTSSGGTLSLSAAQTSTLAATTGKGRYRFKFIANRATNPKTIRSGILTVREADGN